MQQNEQTIASKIASLTDAIRRLENSDLAKSLVPVYRTQRETLIREHLPHGSGIDAPITLDEERSNDHRLVFEVPFHEMDEHGYYCGWTTLRVTVTCSIAYGLSVKAKGRGRFGLRDHIEELMRYAITRPYEPLKVSAK
jgi:hypothetical protein